MRSTARKIFDGFVGAVVGTVSFPFAISYHVARPFYEIANNPKCSGTDRLIAATGMVLTGILSFLAATLVGATGGALIGTGYGAYHGYNKGFAAGCTSLFSKTFGSHLNWFFFGNTPHPVQANSNNEPRSSSPKEATRTVSTVSTANQNNSVNITKSHRDQPANMPPGSSLKFAPIRPVLPCSENKATTSNKATCMLRVD